MKPRMILKNRIITESGIQDPWLDYVWRRANKYNKACMILITGDSGDGKSWSALKIAEIVDKSFTIDNVVFSAKDYMTVLDGIKRKGTVVIWDEIGVGANSRKWQSIENIAVTEVMETQRYLRPIVILTVPRMYMSDSNIRGMVDFFCQAKRYGTRPAELYVYMINRNERRNRIYYPHPRIKVKVELDNGETKTVKYKYDKTVFRSLPSKELRDAYEEKHKAFKAELRKRNLKSLAALTASEISSDDKMRKILESVLAEPDKYINKTKTGIDWNIVRLHSMNMKLKLSRDDAQGVAKMVENELGEKFFSKDLNERE